MEAWNCILAGKETKIDLPRVEFAGNGGTERRWFAQLAGAGLDARAVESVEWSLKKKVGPLAYVWAGLRALAGTASTIEVSVDGAMDRGELVLIGNGGLYGGNYCVHPKADLRDGVLEVCVFPKVNWLTLARCGPQLLVRGTLPRSHTRYLRGSRVTLASAERTPLELDGELAGLLPATFSIERDRLRVIVPEPVARALAPAR
jgi:diacylglycerol kinase family enzyme